MIEFFDFLRVKPESLTVFFEENGSEKGWVVSLQVNESDFRKTEISSQISHKYEKSSLCHLALGIEDYGGCPIHILVFMVMRRTAATYSNV
mgnify:CR=1 FL=1